MKVAAPKFHHWHRQIAFPLAAPCLYAQWIIAGENLSSAGRGDTP
jgi:hypothetical protein